MLKVSESTLSAFQNHKGLDWVEQHVQELKELAPDDIVYFIEDDLRAIVTNMLERAEILFVKDRDATIAFCYASLKLGVGFEADGKYRWAQTLPQTRPELQADMIWDYLSSSLDSKDARPS